MNVFDRVASLVREGDSNAAKRLASALDPLAAIAEDVPKRAAAYILTGADSVVLTAIENAPHDAKFVVPARYSYIQRKMDMSHAARLRGLGLVLAACWQTLPYALIGTNASPTWFRALLEVAAKAHTPPCEIGGAHFGALTLQRCLDVAGNEPPEFLTGTQRASARLRAHPPSPRTHRFAVAGASGRRADG